MASLDELDTADCLRRALSGDQAAYRRFLRDVTPSGSGHGNTALGTCRSGKANGCEGTAPQFTSDEEYGSPQDRRLLASGRGTNGISGRLPALIGRGRAGCRDLPPYAVPAVTHGASEQLFPAVSYAFTYNVIGAPAGVVSTTRLRPGEESDRKVGKDIADRTAQKAEWGSAGLPVGVQVVARHWHDHVSLAVMSALEAHFRKTRKYQLQPDLQMNVQKS